MKCFSLIPDNYLALTGSSMHPSIGSTYVIDAYPRATNGFKLDEADRSLRVGFVETVAASPELLRLPPGDAIERDGRDVKVLRASLDLSSGKPVLVPEKDEDRNDALLYIGIGSGYFSFVRYRIQDGSLVAHSRADGEDGNDKALVRLRPFETVTVVRSDKRWIFWGAERIKEELVVSFDGANIFYESKRRIR